MCVFSLFYYNHYLSLVDTASDVFGITQTYPDVAGIICLVCYKNVGGGGGRGTFIIYNFGKKIKNNRSKKIKFLTVEKKVSYKILSWWNGIDKAKIKDNGRVIIKI